jgi:hypothetical protein
MKPHLEGGDARVRRKFALIDDDVDEGAGRAFASTL